MGLRASGWKNKQGTSNRSCNCGTWKNHWINYSNEPWPDECLISTCDNEATLGAHIINSYELGEYIAPACDSCNKRNGEFALKQDVILVSANKQKTCE